MGRSTSITALALTALATCVPLVEQEGLPCPCSPGVACCEASNTCISSAEDCPAATGAGASSGGSSSGASSKAPAGSGGSGGEAGASSNSEAGSAGDPGASGSNAGGSAGSAAGSDAAAGGQGNDECGAYSRKANVLLLAYNPVLESGQTLQEYFNVADWKALSATLAQQLTAASGGVVNYRIVWAFERPEWPPQLPGTMPLYEETFFKGPGEAVYDDPLGGNADYPLLFQQDSLCQTIAEYDISQVWLWGAGNDGFTVNFGLDDYRYRLQHGLRGNPSQADIDLYAERSRDLPDCGRSYSVMGFQYRLGVSWAHLTYNVLAGELVERALRTESSNSAIGIQIWDRFKRFGASGASVGEPLFPPNALYAGDFANAEFVHSDAANWSNYPSLEETTELINCGAWGCSQEGFQNWYSFHFPRFDGTVLGTCKNWWKYVADPHGELEPCAGEACTPNSAQDLPCVSHSDCASNRCACKDVSATVCTLDPGEEECDRANWALCETGDDCQSGVCGCNGDVPPKRCLPSNLYDPSCLP